MVLDWGMDSQKLKSLTDVAGDYVDFMKIPIGTPRLYRAHMLGAKLSQLRSQGISPYLGGGFIEHLLHNRGRDALVPFLEEAGELGFEVVEISDNYIPLDRDDRTSLIRTACELGYRVFGEVGSKHEITDSEVMISQSLDCLGAGAEMVVLEGAEFVSHGALNTQTIDEIASRLDLESVMWEVPGPWVSGISWWMAQDLVKLFTSEFGPDVNLGNIMPDDALHTEALRVGLGVVQPVDSATPPTR
jgi:phosphosulfolactate synthase